MPIYAEVEGVGRLEFPDGTDPAVIQATVKRVVSGGDERVANLQANWAKNNPIKQIGNVQRGAIDVIGGGAQLLARGANAAGLVPESTGSGFIAGPKEVEAQNAQARANVDQWFGKEAPGFNPVRAASAGALTIPLAPTKFLQAPSIIGRSVGAGGAGAVAGGLQEVQNPKDAGDFWQKKGLQVGVGGVGGALAQPLAEKVVGFVVSALNKGADKAVAGVREMTGANSIDKIVNLTRETLKKSGIDYDTLNETAKQGLLDDVQKALGSYSGLEPGAVARQAAFRQEGFKPLSHWVSKNPSDFSWFENLAGVPGVGAPLQAKKNALDKHVLERLNQLRGKQILPEEAGATAAKDLSAYVQGEQGKTNVLYNTFREIAPDVKGDPQRFANDVFGGLEGKMAGAALPAPLRELVNKFSSGEIPLTPDYLYQLQKMAKPGADGTANYAIGHLRKAIDRELDAISKGIGAIDRSMPVPAGTKVPDEQGKYAADVLKMARAQAAKVFHIEEHSPVVALKAPGMHSEPGSLPPESFTDTFMKAPLKEMASAWSKLGGDAKDQVRSQVLDQLKRKAFGGASDDSGKTAAQATFNNYLSEPANVSRLKLVLGVEKFQELKSLGLMLEAAHLLPSGNKVNTSNTGAALIGFGTKAGDWMKAKGIPGSSWAQDSGRKAAADAAFAPTADLLGKRSLVVDPEMEELIKRLMGGGAGLLAGPGTYGTASGLLGF